MSSLDQRKSRIQSLNPRSPLPQQHPTKQLYRQRSSQEQVDRMTHWKVNIPASLANEMGLTKGSVATAEACLRPLQTNNRKPMTGSQKEKLKPIQQVIENNPIDPVNQFPQAPLATTEPNQHDKRKPNKRTTSYKLVEDKDVPPIIKDFKRKVQYRKMECLGFGAFGRVYRVQSFHDAKYWAAKVIAKSSIIDKSTKKKLFARIKQVSQTYIALYLLIQLLQTLSTMLKRRGGTLTEPETRYYMGQILTALRYMSDNRILHRDLKLSNVLLDRNMDCKLGDFGLAALLLNHEDRKRTVCGTLHYIAPEILFHKEVNGHNHRVDMWSAGVLMYNLLFGKHPFPKNEPRELREQVRQNQHQQGFKFPVDSFVISSQAKHLISSLLVNDPDQRLTVIEALKHPFFSMAMPLQIPKSALQTIPTNQALFGTPDTQFLSTPSTSKVTVAIQDAKDSNKCYEDTDIQPPMIIMDETIIDHRSQYPLPNSQKSGMAMLISSQPGAIPVIPSVQETLSTSTASKRRAANSNVLQHDSSDSPPNTPAPPKRLCSDGDIRSTISAPVAIKTTVSVLTTRTTARKELVNTNSSSPSSSLALKLETTQISQTKPQLASQKTMDVVSIHSTQESQSQNLAAPISVYSIQQTQSQQLKQPISINSSQQSTKHDIQGFAIPQALPIRRPMMEQMEDNIKIMIGRSESMQMENRTRAQQCPDFQWSISNLFIETWVDCSKHYGFAYRLSDGTLGFLYNDGSVLTCCDGSAYYYVSYRAEDDRYVEQIYTHVPHELEKKASLLQRFGAYEEKELKHDQSIPKSKQLNKVYLLKYYVSKEAITFRLSNGVIQLNFFKHYKLILYDAGKKVMFIDSDRKLTRYNTYDVLCSTNTEIIDTIQYAFSILQLQNSRRQKVLQQERWKRFEKD
ncbi:protein serine/threonine kinase [Mucor ambiguus]|uniref:Serine/threonine-protein kinase n=1 Tax=Mucor ambiguus TaxID=91626 RepID=A0A0C9MC51_9FUNG|nr:protein serine/threonine kinase [Mucor ambiguus]